MAHKNPRHRLIVHAELAAWMSNRLLAFERPVFWHLEVPTSVTAGGIEAVKGGAADGMPLHHSADKMIRLQPVVVFGHASVAESADESPCTHGTQRHKALHCVENA
jgi:hypothetical protein